MVRASDVSVGASGVSDLVARCLEIFDREGAAAVEVFLDQHPGEAPDVRQRLQRLSQLGFLSGSGPLAAPQEIPARLGSFRLIERLGAGGMGVVYLAEDETLGRQVALKVVRPDLLLFGNARARFRREIEAIARLKHPGILPVYSTGEEGGVPFFTMEYVDGCSLSDVLACLEKKRPVELSGALLASTVSERSPAARRVPSSGPPRGRFGSTWTEACFSVALAVAEAMEHAHERGVLHRDVKPSNVMITRDGRVLLLDFGLASNAEASRITSSGAQVGSLPYMAPEQVRGEEALIGVRSDVYSLGATLYELLTLRCPFLAPNAEVTRKNVLEGRPAPIRASNPQVPSDAETVCLTAMDKDPARRYASAAAFAEDLRNFLEHRPTRARRPGVVLRARRFAERNPATSVAATLGSLLAAGAVGFAMVQASKNHELRQANRDKDAALRETRTANEAMRTALARKEQINGILLRMLGAPDPWENTALNPVARDTKVVDVLEYARKEIEEDRELDLAVAADVSSLLGGTYSNLGMLEEAEPLLVRALDLNRRAHGEDSSEAIQTAWRLASLRFDQHRLGEARAILEEALGHAERVLPAGHGLLRDLQNDLALTFQVLGDLGRAEELYRRQLASSEGADESVLGQAMQVALVCHNLGTLLMDRGEWAEAGTLVERALALRRRHLPEGHARILASLNALGVLRNEEGRFAEALPIFQEVLEQVEQALGEHHERTLRTRISFCAALLGLERFEEAEEEARFVIGTEDEAPEAGNPVSITARLQLARSLAGRGEAEGARAACDEARELLAGPDDPRAAEVEALRESLRSSEE